MKKLSIKNIFGNEETVQLYFSYHAAKHGEFYSIEIKGKDGKAQVIPYTSTSQDKNSAVRNPADEMAMYSVKKSDLKNTKKHQPLLSGIGMNPEAAAAYSQAKMKFR